MIDWAAPERQIWGVCGEQNQSINLRLRSNLRGLSRRLRRNHEEREATKNTKHFWFS